MDLKTKFAGLNLKNPIIVGSSGLTSRVEDIVKLASNGAAAVVIKSIFEEEIMLEYEQELQALDQFKSNMEFFDYYDYKIKEQNLSKYRDLIKGAKAAVDIPVIASINCVSTREWTEYADHLQKAGADALELNVFLMPSNFSRTAQETEDLYFNIIKKVKQKISLPLILKMGYYFSNLGGMIQKLSQTDIKAIVLFNRFFSPDIEINKQQILSTNVFSTASELPTSLRWIGIMAERVNCDLAASTGIHSGEAVIKQLLAGADAVQVVSALYQNGPAHIGTMLADIQNWMKNNNYQSLDQFRGQLSQARSEDPALYERVQFMKYFSDRDK